MHWFFIDTGFRDPYFNMAFDEVLMDFVRERGVPVLRFFNFSPEAITIGFHQRVGEWLISLKEKGIPFVRRPTGGRAVIHSGDFTYSITFTRDDPLIGGETVLDSYKKIAEGFKRAFDMLGVQVDIVRGRGQGDDRLCFSAPSWYEFTHKGRKLIGSAQVRRGNVALQQGTLMIKRPGEPFPEVKGMVSLSEALGRDVTLDEVKEAVKKGFSEAFGINFVPLPDIDNIPYEKYRSDEWNFKR